MNCNDTNSSGLHYNKSLFMALRTLVYITTRRGRVSVAAHYNEPTPERAHPVRRFDYLYVRQGALPENCIVLCRIYGECLDGLISQQLRCRRWLRITTHHPARLIYLRSRNIPDSLPAFSIYGCPLNFFFPNVDVMEWMWLLIIKIRLTREVPYL